MTQKYLSCFFLLFLALLIAILISVYYYLAVVSPNNTEQGLDYIGAKNKAHQSYQNNDYNEYAYWSKRVLHYTENTTWTNLKDKFNDVAKAYELINEQGKAKEIHDDIALIDNLFLQGKIKEANKKIIETRFRVIGENRYPLQSGGH